MRECNLWWRGKHSTAWAKQEILIVRRPLSFIKTSMFVFLGTLVSQPNMAQGRKCLVLSQVICLLMWHLTIICSELSVTKTKDR